MPELTIIIPFVNEFPQILFTIQSIHQELRDRVDHEIIAVNNYCKEVKQSGYPEDMGGESVKACAKGNPWLKYVHYTKKLSHWQCKNVAVKEYSDSPFLFFSDGHCVISRNSLYDMFNYYRDRWKLLNGTIHLPLTYKILEWHKLIYKLVYTPVNHEVGYSFTGYREYEDISSYEVSCMSTCGMMMSRELFDYVGGWPEDLGIYGGGEHFMNFVLAILGKSKHIFQAEPLYHHGDKRGYSYNYDDYTKNRTIATYMFGGQKMAYDFIMARKGNKRVLQEIYNDVLNKNMNHRKLIKSKQMVGILEWIKNQEE